MPKATKDDDEVVYMEVIYTGSADREFGGKVWPHTPEGKKGTVQRISPNLKNAIDEDMQELGFSVVGFVTKADLAKEHKKEDADLAKEAKKKEEDK